LELMSVILQASCRLSKPILLTSDMNEYCTASAKKNILYTGLLIGCDKKLQIM